MQGASRYLIGIDLGTTNSVVAYIDREETPPEGSSGIHVFAVPQLDGPGEVRALAALPSFLYFPTDTERESQGFNLPWQDKPSYIVGHAARELGALVPGRQVSSAKSWLCQDALDRTADILPRDAEPPEPQVSPVEASARYLLHLRSAWNNTIPSTDAGDNAAEQLFENQDIVLTVPASFDEEARELTVEAARGAGLERLTLLEEPLAAFYAWVAEHQHGLSGQLTDGDLVLICDIGGGTSDFSLVRARVSGGDVQFERTAIGEHLLLGGENLDLALARRVEQKLNTSLSLRQRHALELACSAAKERLLGDDGLDHLPISILGSGRSVVGQMLSSELTRDEVVELLTGGFLPLTALDDLPRTSHAVGLREVGLPYASDPAITKHLAAFLRNAATASRGATSAAKKVTALDREDAPGLLRPDAVLFNGGFCIPHITRERIVAAIAGWFAGAEREWRPRILHNAEMGGAVAIGAAYYARVRRGTGLRVKAGSARTYYVGMRSEQAAKAVCVLPAGTDEGTTLPLTGRDFSVLANRPVSFTLFSSTVRHDSHGALADLDLAEMHRHAPLVTLLRYGKRLEPVELAVRLSVSFTEVGTLELWCEAVNLSRRWRLQFELRGTPTLSDMPSPVAAQPVTAAVSDEVLQRTTQQIRAAFAKSLDQTGDPATLTGELEKMLGMKKESWPLAVIRPLGDALLEVGEGRKLSSRHETRWLNLLGYCLRPGFGEAQDGARLGRLRKIYQGGLAFPELQNQVDWLVLWRRVAGGMSAAQQHELRNYLGGLGIGRKKAGSRLNPQVEREGWRLLASLEHLSGATRAALGSELLRKLKKEPADSSWLWSLGRFGVRIPLYGSLTCVVPRENAEEWVMALLGLREITAETASAVVQMARLTGNRERDLSEHVRQRAVSHFADEAVMQPLQSLVYPERADVARTFGEPLPKGISLESTLDCLSPVSAITLE